jgi:hypothetical protein
VEGLVADQPLPILDGVALLCIGVANDPSRTNHLRLVSTTWEVAIVGAGAGGLLVYMAGMSHGWGHPVHWLGAGLGVLIGYAVGLIVATPRYTLKRGSKASTPG